MKKIIIMAAITVWALILLLITVGVTLIPSQTLFIFIVILSAIAPLLTVPAIIIWLAGLSPSDPSKESVRYDALKKFISVLVIILLATSTICAIKSFWYNPLSEAGYGNRFVFENIATGTGFAAITLTYILSRLQQDIYWVTRKKSRKLDERQRNERLLVFEKSHKIGFVIIAIAAYILSPLLHNLPTIITYNHGALPGHVHWIAVNLIVLLAALPLILASWRKR